MILHPELLLQAYANGLFPMAESATAEDVFWVDPPIRAIIPLDTFHVPARLARSVRKGAYDISVNRAFEQVIAACALTPRSEKTWINHIIRKSYTELHKLGFAHSVEVWEKAEAEDSPQARSEAPPFGRGLGRDDTSSTVSSPALPFIPSRREGKLCGGLYGVSMGKAFFGESMFSTARDASKIALVHLVARLIRQNYTLLDTQFLNPHLVQFGTVEIPREKYHSFLGAALEGEAFFGEDVGFGTERSLTSAFLQSRTQIS